MFNKKGSISLEASIITPIVLIIFCVLILLLIYIFQYNRQVFGVHNRVLTFNETTNKSKEFQMLDKNFIMTYKYEKSKIDIKTLQQWIHFIMDYVHKYYGIFNG